MLGTLPFRFNEKWRAVTDAALPGYEAELEADDAVLKYRTVYC